MTVPVVSLEVTHALYAVLAFIYIMLWDFGILFSPETGPSKHVDLVTIVYLSTIGLISIYQGDDIASLMALSVAPIIIFWFIVVMPFLDETEVYAKPQIASDEDILLLLPEDHASRSISCNTSVVSLESFGSDSSTASRTSKAASSIYSFPSLTPSHSAPMLLEAPVITIHKAECSLDQISEDEHRSVWIDKDGIAFSLTDDSILVRMGLIPTICAGSSRKRNGNVADNPAHAVSAFRWDNKSSKAYEGQINDMKQSELHSTAQASIKTPDTPSISEDQRDVPFLFDTIPVETGRSEADASKDDLDIEFDLLAASNSCAVPKSPSSGDDLPRRQILDPPTSIASPAVDSNFPDSSLGDILALSEETSLEVPRHAVVDADIWGSDDMETSCFPLGDRSELVNTSLSQAASLDCSAAKENLHVICTSFDDATLKITHHPNSKMLDGLAVTFRNDNFDSTEYCAEGERFRIPGAEELDEPSVVFPSSSFERSLLLEDHVPKDMSLLLDISLNASSLHANDFEELCRDDIFAPSIRVTEDIDSPANAEYSQTDADLSISSSASSFAMEIGPEFSLIADASFTGSDVSEQDFAPLGPKATTVSSSGLSSSPETYESTMADVSVASSTSFAFMLNDEHSILLDTSLDIPEDHDPDFAPLPIDSHVPLPKSHLFQDTHAFSINHDQNGDTSLAADSSFTMEAASDLSMLQDISLDMSLLCDDDFISPDPGEQHYLRASVSATLSESSSVVAMDFGADLSALLEASMRMSGTSSAKDGTTTLAPDELPYSSATNDDLEESIAAVDFSEDLSALLEASISMSQYPSHHGHQLEVLGPDGQHPSILSASLSESVSSCELNFDADLSALLDVSLSMSQTSSVHGDDFCLPETNYQYPITRSTPPPLSQSPSTNSINFSADFSALLDVSLSLSLTSSVHEDDFSPLDTNELAISVSNSFTMETAAEKYEGLLEESLTVPEDDDDYFAPLSLEEKQASASIFGRVSQAKGTPDNLSIGGSSTTFAATKVATPEHHSKCMTDSPLFGTPALSSSSSCSTISSPGSPSTPLNLVTNIATCHNVIEPLTDKISAVTTLRNDFDLECAEAHLEWHGKRLGKKRLSAHSTLAILAMHNNALTVL